MAFFWWRFYAGSLERGLGIDGYDHPQAARLGPAPPQGAQHRRHPRGVDSAQFFHDWNIGKKQARASARLKQNQPSAQKNDNQSAAQTSRGR